MQGSASIALGRCLEVNSTANAPPIKQIKIVLVIVSLMATRCHTSLLDVPHVFNLGATRLQVPSANLLGVNSILPPGAPSKSCRNMQLCTVKREWPRSEHL